MARLAAGAIATVCLATSPALGGLIAIDFSTDDSGAALGNGQIMGNGVGPEFGVIFEMSSAGPNEGLAIFDSTPGLNGSDEDLWIDTGNLLILQKEGSSRTGDFFDNPNDEADGGSIFFDFLAGTAGSPVSLVSIDLVDINGNHSAIITLVDAFGGSRIYDVPSEWTGDVSHGDPGIGTLDLTTLLPQVGFESTATATDNGFDIMNAVSMEVELKGSGAMDNIVLMTPAPGAAIVLLAGLAAGRRRRPPVPVP
jgi:hypothetical protein